MSTSLPADAWPFLIARSRSVGQRTVLAPGFLTSTGRHVLLKSAVTQPQQSTPDWLRQNIHIEPEGEYTLFFRTTTAHPRLVGQDGDALLDESSRKVDVTEGVMIAGEVSEPDPQVMAEALRITAETFRAFWLADDRDAGPVEAPRLLPGHTADADLRVLRPPVNRVATAPPPQVRPPASRAGDDDRGKPDQPPKPPPSRASGGSIPWWGWLALAVCLAGAVVIAVL
jgi:hypothetical protein